jgi:hypothetical protein
MGQTRRTVLISFAASALLAQDQQSSQVPIPAAPNSKEEEDQKLPDGRSQKNAIAKQEHEAALKDADQLIGMAQQLKDELQKAGDYVVPLSSVKKTEEIEKLARRIRGRLRQ